MRTQNKCIHICKYLRYDPLLFSECTHLHLPPTRAANLLASAGRLAALAALSRLFCCVLRRCREFVSESVGLSVCEFVSAPFEFRPTRAGDVTSQSGKKRLARRSDTNRNERRRETASNETEQTERRMRVREWLEKRARAEFEVHNYSIFFLFFW